MIQNDQSDVADADIKAMFIASTGDEIRWLGAEGSYFIEGVRAGRAESKKEIESRDARIDELESELERAEQWNRDRS